MHTYWVQLPNRYMYRFSEPLERVATAYRARAHYEPIGSQGSLRGKDSLYYTSCRVRAPHLWLTGCVFPAQSTASRYRELHDE